MQITASQVQSLRERTGAGMMDCKKALTENGGDFDKSVEYLRKKGMASAAKKEGRTAKDGTVLSLIDADNQAAVLVEVNCETDFVAKTDNFQKFVTEVARHIAKANPANADVLATQAFYADASKTVGDFVKEAIATLGENIKVRRFARYPLTAGKETRSYIHMGGKVGVLVELNVANAAVKNNEVFTSLIRDLTMHVAAAAPQFLNPSEVPADVVAKEKEIALAQLQGQNKPADVLEKIASGKINKFYEETCFLNQRFIKDDKKTIEALVKETAKALGTEMSVVRFTRYLLGEGVEVVAENA